MKDENSGWTLDRLSSLLTDRYNCITFEGVLLLGQVHWMGLKTLRYLLVYLPASKRVT